MPRDSVSELEVTSYRVEKPVTDGTLRVLIEARELLSDPRRWTRGDYCRGDAFCIMGALGYRLEGQEESFARDDALCLLGCELPTRLWNIPAFNDRPTTTHADVLALFDRAIARRRAELEA